MKKPFFTSTLTPDQARELKAYAYEVFKIPAWKKFYEKYHSLMQENLTLTLESEKPEMPKAGQFTQEKTSDYGEKAEVTGLHHGTIRDIQYVEREKETDGGKTQLVTAPKVFVELENNKGWIARQFSSDSTHEKSEFSRFLSVLTGIPAGDRKMRDLEVMDLIGQPVTVIIVQSGKWFNISQWVPVQKGSTLKNSPENTQNAKDAEIEYWKSKAQEAASGKKPLKKTEPDEDLDPEDEVPF